uniref:Piezo TM1-24 domain-containing protein n=1 Tax=Meloidogyne javanica TaxID=6303 RepID=A0A915M208_MELJA
LLLSLPFFALSRLNLREIKYNSLSTQDRLKHLKNYGTFDESNIDGGGKLVVGEERKEISFRFFRNTIFAFLTLLIIYSSLVLISIYCYQFPSVPEFLNKLTGLNLKLAEEIGLQKYEGEDFGVTFALCAYMAILFVVRSVYQGYTLILILIGLQFCIKYRQHLNRKLRSLAEPPPGILFPNAQPADFDKSLTDCTRFLLNYGFYKFGMEIIHGIIGSLSSTFFIRLAKAGNF